MAEFVAQHSDIIYAMFAAILGVAVYFYKLNETKTSEIITHKLDHIAEKLDELYDKNVERKNELRELFQRTAKLETALAQQKQRCDDRANACPGAEAKQAIERMRNGKQDNV